MQSCRSVRWRFVRDPLVLGNVEYFYQLFILICSVKAFMYLDNSFSRDGDVRDPHKVNKVYSAHSGEMRRLLMRKGRVKMLV